VLDERTQLARTSAVSRQGQTAGIKSDQTVLKGIRRDLERLKAFPSGNERVSLFLSSVKAFPDGVGQLPGA
jgi:hypothetical protein